MPAAYLETLNPQQRRAAEHGVEDKHTIPGEPLLIIAGAGSGKYREGGADRIAALPRLRDRKFAELPAGGGSHRANSSLKPKFPASWENAVDEEGFILGLDDEFWFDQGAYLRTHGVVVTDLTCAMLPGPYVNSCLPFDRPCAAYQQDTVRHLSSAGTFRGEFRPRAARRRDRRPAWAGSARCQASQLYHESGHAVPPRILRPRYRHRV